MSLSCATLAANNNSWNNFYARKFLLVYPMKKSDIGHTVLDSKKTCSSSSKKATESCKAFYVTRKPDKSLNNRHKVTQEV